jgi:hypothetical protein
MPITASAMMYLICPLYRHLVFERGSKMTIV